MPSDGDRSGRARIMPLWLVLGLAVIAFCLVVWFGRGADHRSEELPPIPSPNGYDDVLAGGRDIEKRISGFNRVDLSTADEKTLTAVVDASREGVVRGRVGLDRPFQVPVVLDLDEIMKISIKEAGSIRSGFARALAAEGRLAALRKQTDQAARADVDLLRLGDAMSHRVPLQDYMISIAVQGMGLRLLRDLHTELNASECRRLIEMLEPLEKNREPVSNVIRLEHRVMDFNLNKMGVMARASLSLSGYLTKEKRNVASTLESLQRRHDVTRRLLIVALALRAYRLEHDDAPEALDALVPSYLKSVPIDPYTEKPLIYRKDGKEALLYSTGPDRDDDKLDPVLGRRHLETSNGDFTLNSF
jgi:hypothetical protein